MTDNNSSREKIIQASIDEFAEKGFEGARVAMIAKRAGVSQALLYYNYPSKQAILDEIIDTFVKQNIDLLKDVYPGGTEMPENAEAFKQALHRSLEFIRAKSKVINILLMQALLKTQGNKALLTILSDLNSEVRERMLSKFGYSLDQDQGVNRKVVDFFYIFIPYIIFGVLGEEWSKKNNVDGVEVEKAITKVAEAIYGEFLK